MQIKKRDKKEEKNAKDQKNHTRIYVLSNTSNKSLFLKQLHLSTKKIKNT